jgi:hypothetical protein
MTSSGFGSWLYLIHVSGHIELGKVKMVKMVKMVRMMS